MHQYLDLNEGTYSVQVGFRKDTAIIKCSYISHRIQVYDAHSLKILDGATVFWTEVRRFYTSSKRGTKEIIQAVIVGIKHCDYLSHGKEIIATVRRIKQNEEGSYQIIGTPINKKLPQFILLHNNSFEMKQQNNQINQIYYWCRFLYWNYCEIIPTAYITGIFSLQKTPQSETQAILYDMQIRQNPCKLLSSSLLQKQQQIQLKQYENQFNYFPITTHKQFNGITFTIDPLNSLDIQDALSIEQLNENLFEIGIHISDVSSFKHLFSRQQAVQRGTSIYLPHKTIYMIPQQIIHMCALKPRKNRLAFSIFIQIDLNGIIYSTKFQKTIVKSIAQLNYQQTQNIINDTIQDKQQLLKKLQITQTNLSTIGIKLKIINTIAKNHRKNRTVIDIFDRNQVTFQLDNKNFPLNIKMKKRLQSQKMVQEMMIMTNYQVAKKIVNNFGQNSLIMYHPKPFKDNIINFNDTVTDFGFKIKKQTISRPQQEIQNIIVNQGIKDQTKEILLLTALQIQQQAFYTICHNSQKGHYGLNLEYYTHFTSPMRRFADLIVHQQLERCLNHDYYSKNEIQNLKKQINLINISRGRSKRLKQKIIECFINLYLSKKEQQIQAKGFIKCLGLKSMTIYLPYYNIIKEINWPYQVNYLDHQSIEMKIPIKNGYKLQIYTKYQCINLNIICGKHQQLNISLILSLDNDK